MKKGDVVVINLVKALTKNPVYMAGEIISVSGSKFEVDWHDNDLDGVSGNTIETFDQLHDIQYIAGVVPTQFRSKIKLGESIPIWKVDQMFPRESKSAETTPIVKTNDVLASLASDLLYQSTQLSGALMSIDLATSTREMYNHIATMKEALSKLSGASANFEQQYKGFMKSQEFLED